MGGADDREEGDGGIDTLINTLINMILKITRRRLKCMLKRISPVIMIKTTPDEHLKLRKLSGNMKLGKLEH